MPGDANKRRRGIRAAAVLMLALGLAACGGDDEPAGEASSGADAACTPAERPEPKRVDLKPPRGGLRLGEEVTATVTTNCGEFEIALDTQRSPKTSASFVHMAKEGVYNDTSFHRVVPGFVIQGGDPLGDGSGGPGYSVRERPPQDAIYARGVVAMAKTQAEPPGTSGSQFFVVTAPADAGLPPQYAILGEVVSGEETVERIAEHADPALGPEGGEPVDPVVIESVTISR